MRPAVPLALLVAACASYPAPVVAPVAGAGAVCNAAPVQRFVGQAADAVAADALRLSGARTLRRYATGDVLTMDYRADRLDVEVGADGRIVALRCG